MYLKKAFCLYIQKTRTKKVAFPKYHKKWSLPQEGLKSGISLARWDITGVHMFSICMVPFRLASRFGFCHYPVKSSCDLIHPVDIENVQDDTGDNPRHLWASAKLDVTFCAKRSKDLWVIAWNDGNSNNEKDDSHCQAIDQDRPGGTWQPDNIEEPPLIYKGRWKFRYQPKIGEIWQHSSVQYISIRVEHCKVVADHIRVSHLLPITSKKQQVISEVATSDCNIHFHLKRITPYGVQVHGIIVS